MPHQTAFAWPVMSCTDHSTTCARRQVTTGPLPGRTISCRQPASSSLIPAHSYAASRTRSVQRAIRRGQNLGGTSAGTCRRLRQPGNSRTAVDLAPVGKV
jgi:hypothetical protein